MACRRAAPEASEGPTTLPSGRGDEGATRVCGRERLAVLAVRARRPDRERLTSGIEQANRRLGLGPASPGEAFRPRLIAVGERRDGLGDGRLARAVLPDDHGHRRVEHRLRAHEAAHVLEHERGDAVAPWACARGAAALAREALEEQVAAGPYRSSTSCAWRSSQSGSSRGPMQRHELGASWGVARYRFTSASEAFRRGVPSELPVASSAEKPAGLCRSVRVRLLDRPERGVGLRLDYRGCLRPESVNLSPERRAVGRGGALPGERTRF